MINILLSGGLSLIFALIGTPLLIRFLTRRQYGQFIREAGPTARRGRAGRGVPRSGAIFGRMESTPAMRRGPPCPKDMSSSSPP